MTRSLLAAGAVSGLTSPTRSITDCDIYLRKSSQVDILLFVKTITWTYDARRAFRKLSPNVRADIEAKIERFARTGAGNVKRLTGQPGARLRVGDRRVIFVETATTIEVRAVGNRRDIYN